MIASEIVQMYKEAKEKRKQIKILAELNLCSQEEIKTILRENGVRLPGGVKQPENGKCKVESEKKKGLSESEPVKLSGTEEQPTAECRLCAVEDETKKEYSDARDSKRIWELEVAVAQLKECNKDLEDEACGYLKSLSEVESLTDILLSVNFGTLSSFKGIEILLRQLKDSCVNYMG